jgi:hypothetical protein
MKSAALGSHVSPMVGMRGAGAACIPSPALGRCTLPAACLRTGKWLGCFGRRPLNTHEQQMLEKMKVLDDIVSDSGRTQGVGRFCGCPGRRLTQGRGDSDLVR